MRKALCALLLLMLLCAPARASAVGEYIELEPGLYKTGEDIPSGKYDLRFNGLDQYIVVSYSYALNDEGRPDLEEDHSFSFRFDSPSGWWNPGGFLVTLFNGYLLIENSPCRLWVEP